jgi:hypothetical protein
MLARAMAERPILDGAWHTDNSDSFDATRTIIYILHMIDWPAVHAHF